MMDAFWKILESTVKVVVFIIGAAFVLAMIAPDRWLPWNWKYSDREWQKIQSYQDPWDDQDWDYRGPP